MLQQLLISARSILLGWVTLFAMTYLLDHSVLIWTVALLGPSWAPTLQLGLDCAALAAAGWVIGLSNRVQPVTQVLIFAATLTFWDFGALLTVNVPWLLRLTVDAFEDPRYRSSLAITALGQVLLFGSLIAGGMLSRPTRPPLSIS